MISRKSFIALFLVVIAAAAVNGQTVTPSASNLLRYGSGDRIYGEAGKHQTYFENLMDFRLATPEGFTAGFRLLYDDPPEIGPEFKGIKRRYVEYNKNGFYMRVGNSSSLFGRGLALNLFENRGLAYDTWMDGVKASYQNDYLKASIVGGDIDFRDSVTIVRNEKYKIRGGNIEINPLNELLIGASYVYAHGIIPQDAAGTGVPSKDIKAGLPELYASLNLERVTAYLDWSQKRTTVTDNNTTSTGWGMYGAVSYFGDGYGITLDYKNYSYDVRDPYGRIDYARPTRMLPFQNPPIVQREYSFTLLSRALHTVNFNDEVGFQIEAYYALDDNTTITFNTSFSSAHNKYILNSDGYTFNEEVRSANFLPAAGREYFPYFETFAEVEYYFDDDTPLRVASALREETFFNEFSVDKSSTITRSMVLPVQIQHRFGFDYSLTFQSELEFVSLRSSDAGTNFINHSLQLRGTLFSKFTAGIRYEYTTADNDPSGRKNWTIGELGFRITPANILNVSYGSERGGQICSSGVCRYIQPFSGFRLSLQTQI